MRDVVFRIAPLDDATAHGMLAAIRGTRMLDGIRGAAAVDRAALVDVIRRIAQLAVDCPDIAELDVNPVFARPDGAIAVDARVQLASPDERAASTAPNFSHGRQ
jgi:acyl-CoA synthetase (NDP forming)